MKNYLKTTVIGLFYLIFFLSFSLAEAKKTKKEDNDNEGDTKEHYIYGGLKWRSIGPAMTSGRIADFAVNQNNHSEWFVAVASGNVWKTVNNGTTFSPVFDGEGSYSIGVVTMDPNNHNVIWVGTGENNHQRALGYGDGIYKSIDGGKSWKNMGLEDSRQIGSIVVDPRNSDVVFVAAEGSAWGPGGDRGLYKTNDGGETWEKVLEISENTGINNVVIDPVDPDMMYATAEQRRRHVHTKIGGGPESAVYRSTDGGDTWDKSMKGLPGVHIGGMGIAVSPADHNVVYLIVEAAEDKGGFYRSTDRGASWNKMSDHHASGQYYNEIYCDPLDVDKVYSMETYSHYTEDGGKTWKRLPNDSRHVDDHALWIDPDDTNHMLIGGDGGVYETFDRGEKWLFKTNLPVTQFYRVNVDYDEPFYNVYGGTQDNNTLMGPAQNTSYAGVSSDDWKAILGGDGFWVAIDIENPNIVYCEYQYGNSYRYDKVSGESVNIKPRPRKGEDTYKWNWNAPLVASQHVTGRIYAMANKVFRSDDRGDSWEVISDDLTSGMDRNSWPAMGHYWSYDAVVKDVSTSLFGTGVSFSESPLNSDLLYAGTDDGVLSITTDGGETWRKVKSFEGIPDYTYISDIMADKFDENTLYVSFDNRKRDDFKPYILKSTDQGESWVSIVSDLPGDETVHTLEQDDEVSSLLFAGTEFGAYFSLNGGESWTELKSGIPTVAVRDMVIQTKENDLVVATFGRGFYILDNYTPLRQLALSDQIREKDGHIFDIQTAEMYSRTRGKYGQGSQYYTAENPDFGATFTYYLKEVPKTLKSERKEKEKELFDAKEPIPQPTRNELRAEAQEVSPYLVFTIYDQSGAPVRKITSSAKKGINRINWDLRYHYPYPLRGMDDFKPTADTRGGTLAMPGKYSVSLDLINREGVERLVDPIEFEAKSLNIGAIQPNDRSEIIEFQNEIIEFSRVFLGFERKVADNLSRVISMRQAALQTPAIDYALVQELEKLEVELKDIQFEIDGPRAKASWEELPPMEMPLSRRLNVAVRTHWSNTSRLSETAVRQYEILKEDFPPLVERLEKVSFTIEQLDKQLENAGAAWTPGREIVL
ncbi:MAG TPA: hypothetical protein VJ951_13090 [Bacteroidales bacterium]|nr:hypothetical protein [Bacteroidales bacterium]